MEETLNKIHEIIERYESGEWLSADNLRVLLRELSTNYYKPTKREVR